jgi:hypothetical protein
MTMGVENKRIASLVLASLLAAMLAACGEGGFALEQGVESEDQPIQASDPILPSNPAAVHMKLGLRTGHRFGFSRTGGGQLNKFTLPNASANHVAVGYGRGWAGSIRDSHHSAVYNPTPTGFTDTCGKPAPLVKTSSSFGVGRRVSVGRFAIPLWRGDQDLDYTHFEDRCDDLYREPQGGYSYAGAQLDTDNRAESGFDQWREVKSEWDYVGFYEDASALVSNPNVGALRHVLHYEWMRQPDAILQMTGDAVMTIMPDGSHPRVQQGTDVADISPTRYEGLQAPRPSGTDMADATLSWGVRMQNKHGWRYAYFMRGDGTLSAPVDFDDKDMRFNLGNILDVGPAYDGDFDYAVTIISQSKDPASGEAVGVYYPVNSSCNKGHLSGVTAAGATAYNEERRRWVYANIDDKPRLNLAIIRVRLRGFLGPDHPLLTAAGGADHERLSAEYFVLTGTADGIRGAVLEIETKLAQINGCE